MQHSAGRSEPALSFRPFSYLREVGFRFMLDREYGWYLAGCRAYGYTPIPREEFAESWREFEAHAERLRAAEAASAEPDIAPEERVRMSARVSNDPFVKAILVGMAESQD